MSSSTGPAPAPAVSAARPPTAELMAAFAAIYFVWGSTFLAIRYAVETIPPFAMMAGRCLLGGGILLALGLPIIAYGLIYSRIMAAFGGLIVMFGMFGWALEPSVADESDFDPPADDEGPSKELATVG